MISPLEELTIDEFLGYSDYYNIKYKIIESKGLINYKFRTIYINPIWNENSLTLIHELTHHYYDKELMIRATEDEIESLAETIYNTNKQYIDKYVKLLLED